MSNQKTFSHRDKAFKMTHPQGLSLGDAVRKPAHDARGSDPYNTSGSFDRKKNWARVGKR